jgi:molybdopterin-guanine dinucleotide biosynthesis adapter protein
MGTAGYLRTRPPLATGATSMPLIVQLVGTHRSGKTLALTSVVRSLRRSGRTVAVLKHSHHRLDLPGTDTDRYVRSRANAVVFASHRTVAFLPDDPVHFASELPVDVLLVEGFHQRRLGRRFRIERPEDAPAVARAILDYLRSVGAGAGSVRLPRVRSR